MTKWTLHRYNRYIFSRNADGSFADLKGEVILSGESDAGFMEAIFSAGLQFVHSITKEELDSEPVTIFIGEFADQQIKIEMALALYEWYQKNSEQEII